MPSTVGLHSSLLVENLSMVSMFYMTVHGMSGVSSMFSAGQGNWFSQAGRTYWN